jgi:putative endonuclease
VSVYWVYIIECQNGSLYTGIALDLEKRFKLHLSGKAAKYTRSFKPRQLAQAWQVACERSIAQQIEAYIKKLDGPQKQALVKRPSNLQTWLAKEGRLDLALKPQKSLCTKINKANTLF